MEAESRQSKLKHSIFKYKNVPVCKKCYNIMTYIQGMLEKKLNDSLSRIRNSKTEKRINNKYRKLEQFSKNDVLSTQDS